jgi:ParB/RepB/Spo0J family partition protein
MAQLAVIVMCPRERAPPVPIRRLASTATKHGTTQNAASFKTQGVLAPLLVRELDDSNYEVIAGARRLRAAKLAELESVPVRVVKLSDAEAIEAQCVENLQREDIHPLEEALGFKSLLELGAPYNIAHIADRSGKSEAYIYGRLKLADLIPPVADAFLKDEITIGHALLIAKLQASQQQEAFAAAFRGMWTSEGNSQVLIPVRELATWIELNILLHWRQSHSISRMKRSYPQRVRASIVRSEPDSTNCCLPTFARIPVCYVEYVPGLLCASVLSSISGLSRDGGARGARDGVCGMHPWSETRG